MGLDQYAFVEVNPNNQEDDIEFAYWRKHNRLQGWMDGLWHAKGNVTTEEDKPWGSSFNNKKLYLTLDDINGLEMDVRSHNLPKTQGFFFGTDSYEYLGQGQNKEYYHFEDDMKFIKEAKEFIKFGKTIYYICGW